MRSFNEYADNAARFASPYIRKTSEFFGNASDEAQRWYYAEKKKRQKMCIRDSRRAGDDR